MRTVYIILLFAAAFLALYEQSKAEPNVILMVIAIIVFMIGIMRIMAKVPSKGENKDNDENV